MAYVPGGIVYAVLSNSGLRLILFIVCSMKVEVRTAARDNISVLTIHLLRARDQLPCIAAFVLTGLQ